MTGIETPASARTLARQFESCQKSKSFNSCEWFDRFSQFTSSELASHDFTSYAQVTFFGERHIDKLNQISMAQIIERGQNLDVLALEMFNSRDQLVLDQYLKDEVDLGEVKRVLNRSWNYSDEGYLEMIKAAKRKGLKILAIDNRTEFDGLPFSDNLYQRDQHMAQILAQHLRKNPKDNIFVYTGKMHSFKSLSLKGKILSVTEMLKEHISELQIKNYFLFAKKENALPLHSMRIVSSIKDQVVVESEALRPYVDGAVFLSL